MVCIYCGADTHVINSRPQKRQNHIWRRRQCTVCEAVFTSSETPDLFKSLVVVKVLGLEPFSRDKLFLSVYDSLKHRKTVLGDAIGLTDTVISHLYPRVTAGSLAVSDIIQTTTEILKRFDKAAMTYYTAFHPISTNLTS